MIQERDEERERMKQELQRSKEQVHAYLSQSTSVVTSSMSAVSPGSRPASFISVEESSGTGDLSEKGTQESGGEDDGGRWHTFFVFTSYCDDALETSIF